MLNSFLEILSRNKLKSTNAYRDESTLLGHYLVIATINGNITTEVQGVKIQNK
jgi:hypothetical protein